MLIAAAVFATVMLGEVLRYQVEFERPFSDWFLFDLDGDGRRDVFVLFDEGGGRCSWELVLQTEPRRFERRLRGAFEGVVGLAMGAFVEGASAGSSRDPLEGAENGRGQQLAVIYTDKVELLGLKGKALQSLGEGFRYAGFARAGLSEVPRFWHWSTDLDHDGHDDIHLPGEDSRLVFFGRGDGSFEPARELAVPTDRGAEIGGIGFVDIVSSRPRPVFRDLDGDSRADLCWFDAEGLWYRLQGPGRSFASVRQFELNWLAARGPGMLDRTDVDLEDLDGDGRADLVMSRMQAKEGSIASMQTTLVVLGNRGGDRLFVRKPDTALILEGVVGSGPHFGDVDGDGVVDLCFATYSVGGGALGQWFGKVAISLVLHRGTGQQESPFSGVPSYHETVRIDSEDFERWKARTNAFLHEDLDGDGIADFFVLKRTRQGHRFEVRRGVRTPEEFAALDEIQWSHELRGVKSLTVRSLRNGEPQTLVFIHERALSFFDLR